MLSYFDDHSMSVIDIYFKIFNSHFDFAVSLFKQNNFLFYLRSNNLTAIKLISKYVYNENDG